MLSQTIDLAITGYNTFNTNQMHLFKALPCFEKEENTVEDEDEEQDVFKLLETHENADVITLQHIHQSKTKIED